MNSTILEAEEHVLSTLEKDGSRRWLRPKLSHGRLLTLRRVVAYFLIAVFTLVPFVQINGKPAVLLDIVRRKFTLLGYTFLPTDSLLLAVFAVGSLISIFLLTAFFGRVWCGWACPQTVYMEFVFRPIERLFDGTIGRGGQPKSARSNAALRWGFRYAVYAVICFYLANTFLAYFVGVDTLWQWVRQSPLTNPVPFLVVAFVTVAMMFDFCFFREQLCIIACPYGRFQSVLLDRNSLIVAYDKHRGEPRGKAAKSRSVALPVLDSTVDPPAGDCVDCGLCVTTCPTGIDIRNGLQMECINCTQCIDACNTVMAKVGRPPNLIRYSSQATDAGEKFSLFRPRVVVYPVILTALASVFLFLLINKNYFDAVIIRERGNPYTRMENDLIRNVVRLKVTNRQDHPMSLTITPDREDVLLGLAEPDFKLEASESRVFHLRADVADDVFKKGRLEVGLTIENDRKQKTKVRLQLLGPLGS
ncbi:MAG: cytochrome c oxidase accessory protein CcoG [Planctomycetaceae bacterium]|nr:cytochrome c oxidase accessory protein CcoG [Planctomycetaceae bacterium]